LLLAWVAVCCVAVVEGCEKCQDELTYCDANYSVHSFKKNVAYYCKDCEYDRDRYDECIELLTIKMLCEPNSPAQMKKKIEELKQRLRDKFNQLEKEVNHGMERSR